MFCLDKRFFSSYNKSNNLQKVSEIAYTLGFHTPSHFSSFFKKMSGLLPRGFLEEAQDLKLSEKKRNKRHLWSLKTYGI